MSHRRALPLTLVALGLASAVPALAQYPGSTPPPADVKRGFDRITIEDAKRHLNYLAGPECAGRGTGQPGFQKAADYVAARFKEYGLKPVGDNGTYFQHVPFYVNRFLDEGSSMRRVGADSVVPSKGGWYLTSAGQNVDVTARVVVLRPGSQTPDLSDANLANAIVVVDSARMSFPLRNAISQARAAAIITVADTLPPYAPQVSYTPFATRTASAPRGVISRAALASLMGDAPLSEVTGANLRGTTLQASRGYVRLTAKVESKQVGVPNVVGLIEGSDPTLKAEIVGIGSHLDHEGIVNGVVYPGADDDGSGSTALLQVAAAMQANPLKPRRSVLFMAFCGEEMGLLGSAYYAKNPIFPNEKMVAELQMDMVGRNSDGVQNGDRNRVDKASENEDTMRLVGSKRISTELHNTILDLNKYVNFKFKYDAEDVYTRSDHYNFAKNGIPVAFLFDGFHPDYHQPTDTVDKINWLKLTSAAKLFYLTAMRVANNDAPPKKDVK